jgi:tRNA A-37 threonylcarbamoyl transferase component Bud32
MAAAGNCNSVTYRADQNVASSLSVKCKVKNPDDSEKRKMVSLRPHAATTLGDTWDIIGMMEIRKSPRRNDSLCLVDNDRCVLMTAGTAIILRKCRAVENAEQFKEVALPFVIATGTECSLYVTTLTHNGHPDVKLVGYAKDDGGNAGNIDCGKLPSKARTKLFVALAVLLNKFNKFFDTTRRRKYREFVGLHQGVTENLPLLFSDGKRSSERKQSGKGTGNPSNDQEGGSKRAKTSSEAAAKEAAACGGMFRNVSFPFHCFIHFTDSGVEMDQQKESPFYFKCHSASSVLTTSKEIFLKVWKLEEFHAGSMEAEVRCHRKAFNAGVPVATPVLPDIARSQSADGSEYMVFAVDYIHQDGIEDPSVLLQFCSALIGTVMKLHHQAGLLHCDLKPDNIRWSNGVVKLIDFGHAQSISEATSTPGTNGFEAPEILKQKPNSTKTDAFSVGRIILSGLEQFEDQGWEEGSLLDSNICNFLGQLSKNLTNADPESRWSLTKASNELEEFSTKLKAKRKGVNLSLRRLNDSSSPPTKMAKQLVNSVLAAH